MCRIRFRADGIWLSFPYIYIKREKSEKASYPTENVYWTGSATPLPYAVVDKPISRIAIPRRVNGQNNVVNVFQDGELRTDISIEYEKQIFQCKQQ